MEEMHIPDGILSVPVWATLNAVAVPGIGLAVRRAKKGLAEGHVPLLGVMGAFVFAAQRMNFPVGFGTSGHLLGGAMLAMTCLVQFAVSLYIDRRYDRGMLMIYLDTVWYPIFYWMLNWVVTVMAFPRAIFKRSAATGRWVTTDRGVSN